MDPLRKKVLKSMNPAMPSQWAFQGVWEYPQNIFDDKVLSVPRSIFLLRKESLTFIRFSKKLVVKDKAINKKPKLVVSGMSGKGLLIQIKRKGAGSIFPFLS